MRMSARAVMACIATLALAAAAGCSGGHPRLVQPGEGTWWGYSAFDMKANEPFAIAGEVRLCLDRPGHIEIINVSMEYSIGGLWVDAFAVKPTESPYPNSDSDNPTLWELEYDEGAVEIDRACLADRDRTAEDAQDLFNLGVQFSKPADDTARGANLLIDYVSEGRTFTLRSVFELVLCEGNGREPEWEEECSLWHEIEQYEGHETRK